MITSKEARMKITWIEKEMANVHAKYRKKLDHAEMVNLNEKTKMDKIRGKKTDPIKQKFEQDFRDLKTWKEGKLQGVHREYDVKLQELHESRASMLQMVAEELDVEIESLEGGRTGIRDELEKEMKAELDHLLERKGALERGEADPGKQVKKVAPEIHTEAPVAVADQEDAPKVKKTRAKAPKAPKPPESTKPKSFSVTEVLE